MRGLATGKGWLNAIFGRGGARCVGRSGGSRVFYWGLSLANSNDLRPTMVMVAVKERVCAITSIPCD